MKKIIVVLALVLSFCLFLVSAAQALDQFSKRSIEGTYAIIAIEQGSGTAMGAALPEAALATAKCDGEGNCTGKLLWNMPDPANALVDRLIINQKPYTAKYGVNKDGFGWMNMTADLTSVGMGEMTIRFNILITQATANKMATEIHYIGKDLLPGGGYPVGVMKLR